MKKYGNGTLKVAATYIGTVVGAGFATGQEILQFFAAFGINGLWGILLTTILFIVFGIIIMELGYAFHARSHLEVINHLGGRIFGTSMDIMISFFLFGSLTAMIAGTGALFNEQFGFSAMFGNIIMAVLAAMTVLTGRDGVINAISAVVPFLLISVIGISAFAIIKTPPDLMNISFSGENRLISNFLLSAILYTSYNTIISIAVLAPLGASAKDKPAIVKGGALGGLALGVSSMMIYLAVCGNMYNIKGLEVPMTYIAGTVSQEIQLIYAIILVAEVYTTAVGSLYGFSARLVNMEKSPSKARRVIIGISIAAFFASFFGFSNLVKYLYPLIGYIGILLLISLFYSKMQLWRK